jgi:hypothetical protein
MTKWSKAEPDKSKRVQATLENEQRISVAMLPQCAVMDLVSLVRAVLGCELLGSGSPFRSR